MTRRARIAVEGRVGSGQIVRVPAATDVDDLSVLADEIVDHWEAQGCTPPVILVGDDIEVLDDRAGLIDLARRCLRRAEQLRPDGHIPATTVEGSA